MAEQAPPVIITCPECGQKMKVPSPAKGKTFKCVKCGAPVRTAEEKPKEEAPINPVPKARMGELLVEQGLITIEQLDEALKHQETHGGKILQILLDLGHLDKDSLHACLSKQPGVASIDLGRFRIDRALLEMIPRELALEHYVLPIDKLGKLLTVAMACPLDTATIAEMERLSGLRVKAVLCKLDDIQKAVDKNYGGGKESSSATDTYFARLLAMDGARKQAVEEVAAREETVRTAPPLPSEDELPTQTPAAPPPAPVAPPPPPEPVGPPLSADIVKRLHGLMESETATLKDVLPVVENCPSLARALIALVNSEAYGMRGQAPTLPVALAMLNKAGAASVAASLLKGAIEY